MNILITGGLGFIGINTALKFCRTENNVVLFDNLSKPGSIKNYKFAKLLGARALIGPGVEIAKGTIIEMGQIVTKEVGL